MLTTDDQRATLERAVLKATGETADTLRARTLDETRRLAAKRRATSDRDGWRRAKTLAGWIVLGMTAGLAVWAWSRT